MCVLVILTWNTGCPKTCLRGHYSPQNATRSKSRVSFENLRKSSFWWALKFFGFDHVGLRNWGLKLGTPCQKHDQIKLSSGSGLLSHNLKWKPCILGENIVILLVIYKIERLVTIPSLRLGKNVFDERKSTWQEKGSFGWDFRQGVTNFKPYFLSPTWSKLNNFSAHQKEDFLRFSKLTLLLFLVAFWGE